MNRQTNIFIETICRFKNVKRVKDLVYDIKDQIKIQRMEGMVIDPQKLSQKYQTIWKKYERGYLIQKQQIWNEGQRRLYLNFLLAYCYLHFKKIHDISMGEWLRVSQAFYNKKILFLMYEGKNLQKNSQRVHWNGKEELALQNCVKYEINGNWASVSYDLFIKTEGESFKTPKQCREHWFNHLNKAIKKGKWTIDEDIKILNFVLHKGRHWSKLGQLLQGMRTEHMIKNRFSTLINMAKKYCNINQTNNNSQSYIIEILLQYLADNRQTIYELSADNSAQILSHSHKPITIPSQLSSNNQLIKSQELPSGKQASQQQIKLIESHVKHNGCYQSNEKKVQQIYEVLKQRGSTIQTNHCSTRTSLNNLYADYQPDIRPYTLSVNNNENFNALPSVNYEASLFSYYNRYLTAPSSNYPILYFMDAQFQNKEKILNENIKSFKSNETNEN